MRLSPLSQVRSAITGKNRFPVTIRQIQASLVRSRISSVRLCHANATILHSQTDICVRLLLFHDGINRNGPSSTLGNPPSREDIVAEKTHSRSASPASISFILLSISASAQSVVAAAATGQAAESGKPARPNILFIIMDDVRIDHTQTFGYDGATPPLTPISMRSRGPACALAISRLCPSVPPVTIFSQDGMRLGMRGNVATQY